MKTVFTNKKSIFFIAESRPINLNIIPYLKPQPSDMETNIQKSNR